MKEWVSLKKKKPPKDAPYLVYAGTLDPNSPFIHIGWYDPKYGWSLLPRIWINAITHWMPLPKPPTKEE